VNLSTSRTKLTLLRENLIGFVQHIEDANVLQNRIVD